MQVHHIGIQVKSLEVSMAFYIKYFGFKEIGRLRFGDEDIVFLENERVCDFPSLKLELIQPAHPAESADSRVHFAWEVESMESVIQDLKRSGLEPAEGPIAIRNGWRVVFYEGPDLEVIELVEDPGSESLFRRT